MHFFKALLVGASAFAVATAQLAFTSVPTSVNAGTQYTITYTGGTGPVSIILRQGVATDLNTITTLTTSATGGSYTWTPDTSLPNGSDYALEIVSGTITNYSGPIALSGGSTSSITMSASASMTSSGSSSSGSSKPSSTSSASGSSSSTVSASTVSGTSSTHSTSSSSSSGSSSTASATTTAASGTLTATAKPSSSADSLSSPLAFVLCAVAAMLYLN